MFKEINRRCLLFLVSPILRSQHGEAPELQPRDVKWGLATVSRRLPGSLTITSRTHGYTLSLRRRGRSCASFASAHREPRTLKPSSVRSMIPFLVTSVALLRDYVPPSCLQQTVRPYPRPRQPRLTTCLTDIIDGKSQEIRPQDGEVFSKMEDVADELPESSPRFILLSHPLTLVSRACSIWLPLCEQY